MSVEARDIVTLNTPFPQTSKLYFPVVEREDGWKDKHGNWHPDPSLKKLLRMDANNEPHILSTVGASYKVIMCEELFKYIEQKMVEKLDPKLLRGVTVHDEWSHDGRDCYRHYTFHNMTIDVDGNGAVALRLIISNSYGNKSVELIVGAIDFYCSNGMIIGTYERQARRHTSGLSVTGLERWISNAVQYFLDHGKLCKQFADTVIPYAHEEALFDYLVKKNLVSQTRSAHLNNEMHGERNKRAGRDTRPTLWHLYSAMTAWATFGDVRDTGNDHAANTRIDRMRHSLRLVEAAAAFLKEMRNV